MTQVFSELFGDPNIKIGESPDENGFSLFSQGIFLNSTVQYIGTFTTLKYPANLPFLPSGSETFVPKLPRKIPIDLFDKLVSFYRLVCKSIKSEVMAMIYYCSSTDKFEIVIPEQTVSSATVKYTYPTVPEDYHYIISSHSHNNFNAFFSSVDDKDEQRAMYYLVVGYLDKEIPTYTLRAKNGNTSFPIDFEMIFDENSEEVCDAVPDSALSKITEQKYSYPVLNGYKSKTSTYVNPVTSYPRNNSTNVFSGGYNGNYSKFDSYESYDGSALYDSFDDKVSSKDLSDTVEFISKIKAQLRKLNYCIEDHITFKYDDEFYYDATENEENNITIASCLYKIVSLVDSNSCLSNRLINMLMSDEGYENVP